MPLIFCWDNLCKKLFVSDTEEAVSSNRSLSVSGDLSVKIKQMFDISYRAYSSIFYLEFSSQNFDISIKPKGAIADI